MNILQQLTDALLDPAQPTHRLVHKAETLLRRSLRLPHLRFEQALFPHETLAVCIFSHLSEVPLETVHKACQLDMSEESSSAPRKQLHDINHIRRVWRDGWQPAAKKLGVFEGADTSGHGGNRLFRGHFFFLVPNLLFTKRSAALLLSRVREEGGDGTVTSNGEKGFAEANTRADKERKNGRDAFICGDAGLLKRFAHLSNMPSRPHKWLSDSIRDQRIKSPELYSLFGRQIAGPTASPTTPSTSVAKRIFADNEGSGYQGDEKPKRMKFTYNGAPQEDVANESTNPHEQLFTTPTSVRETAVGMKLRTEETEVRATRKPTNWACELRTSFNSSELHMNDRICELLGVVQESYAMKKDHFRALGYQKAIARIRSLRHDILTMDDARSLSNENAIGTKIERKVAEIIKTGRLLQAEALLENPNNVAVKTLCDVWGIGPVKAMHLVAQGIKSIEDLRLASKRDPHLLDRNQQIGLRHYEDFLHRIPRKEVAELEMYVKRMVKSIDTSLDITVAGSYLRGKATCGDVDIIIYGDVDKVKIGFPKVKAAMTKSGVLTDDLLDGPWKYFGVFKLPGRRHGRVDLFAVPKDQYPFALLTYTGSAIFNRSMRAKARALGYSLCHESLQRVHHTKGTKTRVEGPIIVKDEKEIFFLLDIPYVPPSARSIS